MEEMKYGVFSNTRVRTPKGLVPICKVVPDMRVHDSNRYREVKKVSMVIPDDYLIGIKANGNELICSRNQRIYTEHGLKYADTISRGDKVIMDDFTHHEVTSVEIRYYAPVPSLIRVRMYESMKNISANHFIIES